MAEAGISIWFIRAWNIQTMDDGAPLIPPVEIPEAGAAPAAAPAPFANAIIQHGQAGTAAAAAMNNRGLALNAADLRAFAQAFEQAGMANTLVLPYNQLGGQAQYAPQRVDGIYGCGAVQPGQLLGHYDACTDTIVAPPPAAESYGLVITNTGNRPLHVQLGGTRWDIPPGQSIHPHEHLLGTWVVSGETEDERVARETRERLIRDAYEQNMRKRRERDARRAGAKARATELFLTFLDADQKAMWQREHRILCRGSHSGEIYEIADRGWSFNVATATQTLCAHLQNYELDDRNDHYRHIEMPMEDNYLGQFLAITRDERRFLRVANANPTHRPDLVLPGPTATAPVRVADLGGALNPLDYQRAIAEAVERAERPRRDPYGGAGGWLRHFW